MSPNNLLSMEIFVVVCSNTTMVQVTWHKQKRTIPNPIWLDCPHQNMTKVEKNWVIRTDIINLENKIKWISSTSSLFKMMAHYKTRFTHIGGWVHHQNLLYGHTSILCAAQCDRAAVNFFTSVIDWGGEICMNTSRETNLPIVSFRSGIWIALCLSLYSFLWNKEEIPLPL